MISFTNFEMVLAAAGHALYLDDLLQITKTMTLHNHNGDNLLVYQTQPLPVMLGEGREEMKYET